MANRGRGTASSGAARKRIAVFSGHDQLGDGLFKLPFVRSLRASFPDAEIHWVSAYRCTYSGVLAPLVAPFIDRVHTMTGLAKNKRQLILPPRIPGTPFDIAIDTQTLFWKSLVVRRGLKPKCFISAAMDYRLSSIQPPDDRRTKPRHFVEHLLRLVELAAGEDFRRDDTPVEIPAELDDLAGALLPDSATGRAPSPYIGIAPGSGDPAKRWPLERFIALARHFEDRGLRPVFMVGPGEADLLEPLRMAFPEALFPEQSLPPGKKPGPLLVAALGRRLAGSIANDSGLGHLLAISSKPLVLLYGRHTPAKYAPLAPGLRTVWAQEFGGMDHTLIPLDRVEREMEAALAQTGP
ncbi:ADP-heptose:LPS heptosyltransferase [Parvibaculum indicum]|uniref:glycosyltransferase family 9 protein n=1 Tax=Parvibaculum indicum TaxID=562969 RepID=UPI00141EB2EB|nr:glycosyltransferase family 9 protein [Parvibaculum indicum]NIJ43351.1 ADP-heptose:LPS heptosyltransferase [Parvibaculum indicum]